MGRGRGIGLLAVLLVALPRTGAAQGWIEPPPGVVRGGFAVEKVRSEVRVRVEGRVAQVEVAEWFRNGGRGVAEGHYLYPLPGEAVFQGFSLFQGDAELRGEIMDAEQARAIYEEIVRRRADPALIELAGEGLLRARIFPIEPGQERRVSLRYTQVLSRAGSALQLVYAGAVRGAAAPRTVLRPEDGGAQAMPEPAETLFEVVVEDGSAFLDPFSPTHDLEVTRTDGRLRVRIEEELRGRFSLFLPLAGDAVGISLAAHRPPGEDGYFMLTLSPGSARGRVEPRDVTVVLDVSGSMSGEKIEQAKSALHGLLGTLSREDRFRLVAFSNAVRVLDTEWSRARGGGLASARAWVDALVADGGTNIGEALDEAFRLQSPGDRLPIVIFLTDGLPSVGEQSPERLADRAARRAGRARVFAFGVGHDVNTHLLDRLGEAGRGSTQYVEPGENVERAMALLAAKVRSPVLTDLEIDGAPVRLEEIYPARIPDVFEGEELVLFGRYHEEGRGAVRVRGARSGAGEVFETIATFPRTTAANAWMPRLWASRKLGHLMRRIWTEGETPGLVEEIETLALRYGLPSPYTSYLVQEPDVVAGLRTGRFAQPLRPALDLAPTAAAASGEAAVRAAEGARQMREAKSAGAVQRAEARLAGGLAAGGSGDVHAVAGRVFRLENGVWTDIGHPADGPVFAVQAYSPAYFRILERLPELRPILAYTGSVIVAGRDVGLQVGDTGVSELDDDGLAALVARFRGPGEP